MILEAGWGEGWGMGREGGIWGHAWVKNGMWWHGPWPEICPVAFPVPRRTCQDWPADFSTGGTRDAGAGGGGAVGATCPHNLEAVGEAPNFWLSMSLFFFFARELGSLPEKLVKSGELLFLGRGYLGPRETFAPNFKVVPVPLEGLLPPSPVFATRMDNILGWEIVGATGCGFQMLTVHSK